MRLLRLLGARAVYSRLLQLVLRKRWMVASMAALPERHEALTWYSYAPLQEERVVSGTLRTTEMSKGRGLPGPLRRSGSDRSFACTSRRARRPVARR